MLTGLLLVTLLLLVFLGDVPLALVTALTIPFAVLFAFGLMSATGPFGKPDFHRRNRFRHHR